MCSSLGLGNERDVRLRGKVFQRKVSGKLHLSLFGISTVARDVRLALNFLSVTGQRELLLSLKFLPWE